MEQRKSCVYRPDVELTDLRLGAVTETAQASYRQQEDVHQESKGNDGNRQNVRFMRSVCFFFSGGFNEYILHAQHRLLISEYIDLPADSSFKIVSYYCTTLKYEYKRVANND